MATGSNDMSLSFLGNAVLGIQSADSLLSCNQMTAKYGLMLTKQQALALMETRGEALQKNGRIEIGNEVITKLIAAFCDSPYITEQNYEDTLHRLIDIFYGLKNDTDDRIGDDKLISCMKNTFNGKCHGAVELLTDELLATLVYKHDE